MIQYLKVILCSALFFSLSACAANSGQESNIKHGLKARLNTAMIYLAASQFENDCYKKEYERMVHYAALDLSLDELRSALRRVSVLIENASFKNPRQLVLCTESEFKNGTCFAPSCSPCLLDNPGPLGTGLLCRKGWTMNNKQPCCQEGGSAPCSLIKGDINVSNSILFGLDKS
ncbi:hypothetical protein [Pseudoalteromonas luteoviolacea]|uniref:Uncharacterized protein n=1 Tax=Pseudoalteromonas luteoviolacea S4054 TaxID=1129367 RepID=A0A0F6A8I5_9GAMM|nr:hypothetical protein [Pseudoalteromonas luteoviolacea]AOT08647.1 hypothetical protein S4054249_12630 [Pseudoalteromonas luteoviolacea]AOT13562.1 hypothetical protein S40542_12605 [Pseudoalteromonas luteoviolacea]AOT18475.1 hypothetical protein S4054_12605 [Pseudoalteromonas luteoviolacea]KKE82527.1 hypothetical protein N479_18135 [Pseudoalteromonas luteoviolacea S4054]KZN72064.1 hypothetical protein N481_16770 [Pseudoalteromonas luteoviolacea S4047-1]